MSDTTIHLILEPEGVRVSITFSLTKIDRRRATLFFSPELTMAAGIRRTPSPACLKGLTYANPIHMVLDTLKNLSYESLRAMSTSTLEEARAAKQKALRTLGLDKLGSVGITRFDGGYALKVNLENPPASPLPDEVDGVPVRIEVVGKIRSRDS
jgi:hypothetical protein